MSISIHFIRSFIVKLLKTSSFVLVAALFAGQTFAISAAKEAAIAERIKPAGSICLEGDSSCAAAVAVASSGPRSGEDIYNASCLGCHSTGAAGAPKMGDVADWSGREQARGLKTLYTNAISGYNGMPAKGLCMDCSDEEIEVTVDYILSQSK